MTLSHHIIQESVCPFAVHRVVAFLNGAASAAAGRLPSFLHLMLLCLLMRDVNQPNEEVSLSGV